MAINVIAGVSRRWRALAGGAAMALAAASGASAQDLGVKAPPQSMPIALINATVHPVSGPVIERGWVLFEHGKITALGGGEQMFIATTRQIDCSGKHVYPGLVAPYTRLGLTEISAVRASEDSNEAGYEGVSPEVAAATAVNPDSTLLPVTRSNGVLTFATFPAGGLIPGRASVMRMDGWTSEDMTVQRDAGLVVNWPRTRPIRAWWMQQSEEDQRRDAERGLTRIRETFSRARAYAARRDTEENASATEKGPIDLRYEAMRSVFPSGAGGRGGGGADRADGWQRPVFVLANDYDQIVSAVSMCVEFGLRPVIVGGQDAPMCAALLKEHDVPVIVQGSFRTPRRDDSPYDEAYRLPAELEEAGVRWCIGTGDDPAHERNLPYSAAMAAAHGLSPEAALRGITLGAAEIVGVGDVLGSIEEGKAATLIVTDGDPLLVPTRIEIAFVDGRSINLSNKHVELYEKYRERYRQTGDLTEEE